MPNPASNSALRSSFDVRGYFLLLTHYDPVWVRRKARERPFDMDLALEIVDELAATGFNTLILSVSDSVIYKSHPEFAKRYSVPVAQLRHLCDYARRHGLDVVPELNFSRSAINCHDNWMRTPKEEWHTHFDDEYYWKTAFETIDEVRAACKPSRYFSIGMDEDHERSYSQYVAAIKILQAGLRERGLRTVAGSDSGLDYASGEIYREKSLLAEQQIPRTSVRMLWNYWAVPAAAMQLIHDQGHELWGLPGWTSEELVLKFKDALLNAGGTGMVMTNWIPCRKPNRKDLLGRIKRFGPLYH